MRIVRQIEGYYYIHYTVRKGEYYIANSLSLSELRVPQPIYYMVERGLMILGTVFLKVSYIRGLFGL